MIESSGISLRLASAPPRRALRRLFLTLFLRGRSSRGLNREGAPKSIGRKLAATLLFYALFGLFALFFRGQTVFALSVYLHAMTFVFLGMFLAASSGEVLFNKEEGDILLHRPISPRALLWAKIGVMLEVSLWLAVAFNLIGFIVGVGTKDGGWLFPVVHAFSTCLEALFCAGCVVLTYQLCLRWFGRERLDGLMTTVQVIVSIAAVLGGQLLPRMMTGKTGEEFSVGVKSWWVTLLPPAWFAGFDDALAGSRAQTSSLLAALAVLATGAVLWLAFGKLSRDYGTGLQTLGEALPTVPHRRGRRWLDVLVKSPPLSWWLRDSVCRASFRLTIAYLLRDRDVKLRVYPGLGPMLIFPFIFLFQGRGGHAETSGFGVAITSGYLGLIPLLGLNLLRYSQQWQAADVFRVAPIPGPASLCHGARKAVMFVLTVPMLIGFGAIVCLMVGVGSHLALLIPGLIMLPIYALMPCVGGRAVPLSLPTEEAKSAGRGITMIGAMLLAMLVGALASVAWAGGWFWWFVLVEALVATAVYAGLRASLTSLRWPPLE